MSHTKPSSEHLHAERDRVAAAVGELTTRTTELRREAEQAARERDSLQHEVETKREQARALRTALSRGEHVRDRLRDELAALQRQRDTLEAAVGIESPPRHHPALMHVGPGRSAMVVDLLGRIAHAVDESGAAELSHLARSADRLAALVERDSAAGAGGRADDGTSTEGTHAPQPR